ncbi:MULTISPECIES: GtrA family protein [Prochlorococcus]|uniref:Uncharacterized conserved membrane protein n=1 Tax=Prochlorococcus marinus (strain SARG / CCMP1375 / SS120) TaxID=167539 RepID=Q7VDJ4_PROMA|nr:Uncharacterized conserved membrane protein [Prochlorococcus marinus subsp. marinus str. CCMP1375]
MKIKIELIKYLAVGFINTCIGYSTILSCETLLKLNPQLSNIIGYLIGIVCSFILNKRYVFRSRGNKKISQFIKFLLGFLLAYTINLSTLNILLEQSINSPIAQGFAMLSYTITFYILCKLYIFKE